MGPEKKVLYIVQSLVAAYIVTGLLLCLLAFIVYQSNTGTKMANLGITLTYIFASILAGMIIGKKIGKRKFHRSNKVRACGVSRACIVAMLSPGTAFSFFFST